MGAYFNFSSEEDLNQFLDTVHFSNCEEQGCDGVCEISMQPVHISIIDKTIDFEELPLLKCKKCGHLYMTVYAANMIRCIYEQLKNRSDSGVFCKRTQYLQRYNYCEDINFEYDSRDYRSIPGLCTLFSNDGFLQPVFFDRKALISFIGDPDYDVDIFSDSYGKIAHLIEPEWIVPFGFNTNKRLVLWLGDIAQMDQSSQYLLKGRNIPSDHLLMDSQFYQAQLNVIWSDPSTEKQIVRCNEQFISNVKKKYNIDLEHLTDQNVELEKELQRPIAFEKAEILSVINAFRRILVEGINVSGLRKLYEKLYHESERHEDYKDFGSIKLIDYILQKLSPQSHKNGQNIIGPLYLVNDFRTILDHSIGSNEKRLKNNILKTLNVSSWDKQEEIYCKEIKGLKRLYQMLVAVTE